MPLRKLIFTCTISLYLKLLLEKNTINEYVQELHWLKKIIDNIVKKFKLKTRIVNTPTHKGYNYRNILFF